MREFGSVAKKKSSSMYGKDGAESIIPADAFGYNLILHSGGEGEEAACGLNLVRGRGAARI